MNCQQAIKLIEKYFDQKEEKIDNTLQDHLNECPDCYHSYKACQSLGQATKVIRENKPELKDPASLTDNIMEAIEEIGSEEIHLKNKKGRFFIDRIAFKRAMAAAAVVLFALFAYEEYVVLDKISDLEQQLQLTGKTNIGWEMQTVMRYNRIKDIKNKISSHESKIRHPDLSNYLFRIK
jgi:hypothetical protein